MLNYHVKPSNLSIALNSRYEDEDSWQEDSRSIFTELLNGKHGGISQKSACWMKDF